MSELTTILSSLKREISALRVAEDQVTFEEAIKGRKFKNPETGNQVNFGSLPAEEQKKLRAEFNEKYPSEEEDSDEGAEEETEAPSWRKNKDKKLPEREQNWINSISEFQEEDLDLEDLNYALGAVIEGDKLRKGDDLKEAFPDGPYIDLSREEAMELLKEVMSRDGEVGVEIAQRIEERSEDAKFDRLYSPVGKLEEKHEEALWDLFDDLSAHIDLNEEKYEDMHWSEYEVYENASRIEDLEGLQNASYKTLKVLGGENIKKILDAEKKFRKDRETALKELKDDFDDSTIEAYGFSPDADDRGEISSLEEKLSKIIKEEAEEKNEKEREEMLQKNKGQSPEDRAKEISSITSRAVEAMKNPPTSIGELKDQIGGAAKDLMDQFGIEDSSEVSGLGEESVDQLLASFETLNTSIKESFSKEKEKKKKENEKEIKELEPAHKEAEARVDKAEKKLEEAKKAYRDSWREIRGKVIPPPEYEKKEVERAKEALESANSHMSSIQAKMDSIALPPETEDMVASYGGVAASVLKEALKQKAKITKDKADAAEAKRVEEAQKKEEEERKAKIKEYEGKLKKLLSKAQSVKQRKEIKPLYNEIGSIKGQLSNSDMLGSLAQSIKQVEKTLNEKSEELSFGGSLKRFFGLKKPSKKAKHKVANIALELLKEEIALCKEEMDK